MPVLIDSRQAAELLGIKSQTLRTWRTKGIGPRYVRFGGPLGRVAYRIQDIEGWIAARLHQSTSEESAKAAGVRF